MKSICKLLLALLWSVSLCQAQNPTPARTDLYHVLFAKAALGKGAELNEYLKEGILVRPCRHIASCCATRMAKTGTMQSSSISEPKPP